MNALEAKEKLEGLLFEALSNAYEQCCDKRFNTRPMSEAVFYEVAANVFNELAAECKPEPNIPDWLTELERKNDRRYNSKP